MPSFPGTQPETVSELLALAAVAEDAARDSARSGPFECPPLQSLLRTAALTLGGVILLECASRRLPQARDAEALRTAPRTLQRSTPDRGQRWVLSRSPSHAHT